MVSQVRKAGAVEIHLRSTESPIRNPCFYGIDFPTREELIVNKFSSDSDLEDQVAKAIGVDSIVFQTLDGLVNALGIPRDKLCLACLNGKYPTEAGRERFAQLTVGGL